jgi:hypothetical protein
MLSVLQEVKWVSYMVARCHLITATSLETRGCGTGHTRGGGGISAYHDVYDKAETLPLTAFEYYYQLMVSFLAGF